MKYATLFRILLFFSFLWPVRLYSQGDKALLRELAEENKKSVDALALYPSETRLAVLEASKYPEVLIKMNDTRLKTAAAFRNLIEDFPRTSQAIFYEITRYPGMLQQLADNSESPDFQQRILDQLPENQRADAWRLVQTNTRTLLKINEIDHSARDVFETVISGYPAPAKSAFRRLVELPEVLEILNEDLRFTVLLGDVYRADPAWVIHKTDSLNLAVAREHTSELDEWKTALGNDTQAQQELEAASKEYAAEYGYDANTYYSDDDLYYQDRPAAPYTIVLS